MFAAGVCIIGATIQCSSFSLAQLIVGRIVLGMGLGAVTATAPNWQSECAGANHRGALVMLEGVFIGIGLAIAAWVNFGMSHTTGPVSWRFALAFPAFWALPVLIIIPFLPESPRWLLKHGRVAEARQTLSVLRDVDLDSEQIHFAINEMETSLAIAGETRFTDLFKMGPHRLFHRVCLAAICQMFQMVTGVNAIAFYIDNIFQVGLQLSTQNAAILSAAFYMMLALSAPIGVGTVDYFGRRKLMLFSSITSGTCLAVLAGAISVPITGSSSRTVDIVASIFLFGYNFGYAIGWLGLPFLFCAEIAPLSHRVPITAISTASTWLWAFVVALVTPVGVTNLAYRYYIIYAVFNLCMILPGKCLTEFWRLRADEEQLYTSFSLRPTEGHWRKWMKYLSRARVFSTVSELLGNYPHANRSQWRNSASMLGIKGELGKPSNILKAPTERMNRQQLHQIDECCQIHILYG